MYKRTYTIFVCICSKVSSNIRYTWQQLFDKANRIQSSVLSLTQTAKIKKEREPAVFWCVRSKLWWYKHPEFAFSACRIEAETGQRSGTQMSSLNLMKRTLGIRGLFAPEQEERTVRGEHFEKSMCNPSILFVYNI